MKDKSKKLTVVNTDKRKPAPSGESTTQVVGGGSFGGISIGGGLDYLLKAIWDKVWEIKTDSQGNEYIFSKLPVVTQYGITMYADGGELNLPSIFEGLPFDNQTIWLNPETGVIEVIGGTGGGSIDSIHWNNIEGKPSFAAVATSGKYADLSEKPDLTKYALQSEIPSLSGYATEKWVTDKNYLDSTKLSDELAKYVTIDGNETINGVKDFANGLMIGGLPLVKMDDDVVYLDAHLVVRGGITMFGTGEDVDVPTIMDALSVDGVNLQVINGVLTFVGEATGGVADSVRWENVIGRPTLLSSFTDDVVKGKYLPLNTSTTNILTSSQSGVLNFKTTSTSGVGIRLYFGETNGGGLWYNGVQGMYLYNAASSTQLGLLNDGTPYYQDLTYNKRHLWHSGNFNPSNYLPLTGGTLTGSGNDILVINRTDGYPYIRFANNGAGLAYFGVNTSKEMVFIPQNSAEILKVLHSGNYSNYALPLSGGTITGTLSIKRDSSVIRYYDSAGTLQGWLGFNGVNNPVIFEQDCVTTRKLLHEGNYSNWALPLSGGTLTGSLYLDSSKSAFIRDTQGGAIMGYSNNSTNIDGAISTGSNFFSSPVYATVIRSNGTLKHYRSDLLTSCDILDSYNTDYMGNFDIDASALSTSNFYPVIFNQNAKPLVVRMYSLGGNASVAYNRNDLEFTFRGQGWNDAPHNLTVHNYNCYTATETTIGCIGMGLEGGAKVVWVRGGVKYKIYSNQRPYLKTANYTDGNQIFTVGTSFSGGTNTKVTTYWIPQTTSGLGTLYHSGSIYSGGGIQIDGGSRFKSDLTINGKLTVDGLATFSGGLTATTGTFNGGVNAQSYGGYNGSTTASSYRWAIYQWNNELQITRRDSSNAYQGTMAGFDLASGNVVFEAGITMYSDQRKKTILNHVELSLKQIADAPLIEHYYNSDESKTTHVGSIAQYWASLNDWFCRKDNEGFYTMEIQNAALASAISIARELVKYESKTDKKIRLLKKRIGELEEEIEKLKTA